MSSASPASPGPTAAIEHQKGNTGPWRRKPFRQVRSTTLETCRLIDTASHWATVDGMITNNGPWSLVVKIGGLRNDNVTLVSPLVRGLACKSRDHRRRTQLWPPSDSDAVKQYFPELPASGLPEAPW
jgi:hypothetical protein